MAEKSRIKPQQTEAETDAALARAYALLIRAGERAAQAAIQNHDDEQDQDGDSDEHRDGRKIRDKTRSTRT
jgi:hypothetical protein